MNLMISNIWWTHPLHDIHNHIYHLDTHNFIFLNPILAPSPTGNGTDASNADVCWLAGVVPIAHGCLRVVGKCIRWKWHQWHRQIRKCRNMLDRLEWGHPTLSIFFTYCNICKFCNITKLTYIKYTTLIYDIYVINVI